MPAIGAYARGRFRSELLTPMNASPIPLAERTAYPAWDCILCDQRCTTESVPLPWLETRSRNLLWEGIDGAIVL
jgi:hypothetical protein